MVLYFTSSLYLSDMQHVLHQHSQAVILPWKFFVLALLKSCSKGIFHFPQLQNKFPHFCLYHLPILSGKSELMHSVTWEINHNCLLNLQSFWLSPISWCLLLAGQNTIMDVKSHMVFFWHNQQCPSAPVRRNTVHNNITRLLVHWMVAF